MPKTSFSRKTLLTIAAIAAAVASAGCGSSGEGPTERTLRIYVSQPLAGNRGGEDMVRAVEIAVANQGSRIDGAEIEVVGLNDALPDGNFDPALVRENARKAAADPSTIAYIGELDSGATELAMPILNRAGILHVSSTSTAVKLTQPSPGLGERLRPTGLKTFARVVPNDTIQSAALTQFMQEESVSKVYIVDDGGTYGLGLRRYFELFADPAGIEVSGGTSATPGTNMVELAQRVERSGADAVLYGGGNLQTGLGGDGISVEGFLEALGDIELDTYLTAPMLPPGNYAVSGDDFFGTYRERYGDEAEPISIFGYEAGAAVMDSVRVGVRGDITTEAITTLRDQTRDAFFSISERPSALGSYSIDANGDTTLTFYGAYRVENGKLVLGRAVNVPDLILEEAE
jgi:branched-chain amino acid transport system substrate-binding protein